MKQRFSSLDLQIITHELSHALLNHRLSNLYDLTTRIFLLKFSRGASKHLLVIDSGFRAHLTQFTRETSPTPSAFTQRLRKFLRTRRVTGVAQLGVDRVLRLEFSDGLYCLYLEFFAGGNVVLTDKEARILAVLRVVPPGEGVQECRIGAVYEAGGKVGGGTVTREHVVEVLTEAVRAAEVQRQEEGEEKPTAAQVKGKKFQRKKKKVDSALKRVLGARLSEFSPVLIEHALLGAGVDPAVKAAEVLASGDLLAKVVEAFREAEGIVKELTTGEGTRRGYIIAKQPQDVKDEPKKEAEEDEEEKKTVTFGSAEAVESAGSQEVQLEGVAKGLVFDDFHPFLPRQFVGVPGLTTLEYEGFNKTVDTFFSSIEAQKLESRLREREAAAVKRLEAARTDHKKRVEGLRDVQDLNVRKAEALEANSMRVEEAIAAVNGLVNQGMDWVQIARLVEGEQKRGNAVAELIQLPLKLYDNRITLKLRESSGQDEPKEGKFVGFSDDEDETDEEEEVDEDDDSQKSQTLSIDVDLALTAYANARSYYDQKRTAAEKETKTLQSSAKALKSTERKITADLKKGLKNEKQLLRPVRIPLWFEKFLFFISSDGYLVLGGRDAQQNDIIYKRYFKRGDVYVHADIQGAATIFVKNNPATPNAPIPPSTLQQAGTLSVSMSQAWDSKAVMSAWWVGFDQIAKTAPSGEYLPVGIFHAKGSKNFLPPAHLILGYGVLWRVDEESKKRHVRHRIGEPSEAKPEQQEQREEKNASDDDEDDVKNDIVSDDDGEFPDVKRDSDVEDEPEDEWFPDVKPNYGSDVDDEEVHGDEDQEPAKGDDDEEQSQPEEENVPVKLEDMTLEDFLTPRKAPVKAKSAASAPSQAEREGAPSPSPALTPHLSAKQRRDLKKGKLVPNPAPASSQEPSRSSTPSQGPTSSTKPLPRGKKAKAKRAAVKYSLQDEEDRELALSLLGVASKTSAAPTAEEEAPKETPEQRKTRLREQHQRAQAVGLAEEARRHQQGADDAEDDEEGDVETPLDSLVPDPYDDDVLLDAIPVCAPWGAMGRYKYRVKLQPGAQKKGKAVREVLHGWIGDKGRMRGKEKDLVTGWKETEAIACVGVGKVKVFGEAGKGAGGGNAKAKGNPARGAAKKSTRKK
ncbi:hypothetical protein BZA05DRAFT_458109 [Tricharina praecox]|uniref:uncharacterized protein n=1 Tax=Tricharina praecox TaxID=43433 RepID=UPI00221F5044|nr:uncharacterized protein BZA05DRAFT_458109 [Tricharina praecox]KAI5846672.1 hypothetical protein BZA05DRAFT_458109 [Tricharina praecox]